MENAKKYLQKVLIYADDSLIGAYRPTIDKNYCQLKSLENFHKVDISNLLKYNKTTKENIIVKSNTLIKTPKCRKKKKHYIKLENIELTLLKNKIFDEYILFITQENESPVKHTVYLEMSGKINKPSPDLKQNIPNIKSLGKKKSRKQPRNYKNLIGFEKIFEENIKNKLLSCLKTYDGNLAANAIFHTNNKDELKLFLTQEIESEKDINIFLKKLNDMNTSSKKIINPNFIAQNVQAFIVLNQNKKDLYFELTDIIRQNLNKPIINSQIIKYDNKKFINANLLNVKLHNLKLYTSLKKTHKPIKMNIDDRENSDYSLSSNTNSLISINEYSFHNIYEMIQQYEHNVTSNYTSTTRSCDNIIKDTYKMLVELQLNAIEQCNQLYLSYFNDKECWSKEKQIKFTHTMKNNYGLLVKLQNKAIENSVFVNKKIKNVNKFINKLTEKTNLRQSCSTAILRQKPSVTSHRHVSSTSLLKFPRKLTSISDYNMLDNEVSKKEVQIQVINENDTFLNSDVSATASTVTVVQKPLFENHEIEVQTSLTDIQQTVDNVAKINKCCSPMNLTETQDTKCVQLQTDISVNKHTSIDFGGQQVQICKRNISLKMRKKKEPIKEKLEEEIAKNVEETKKLQKEILISPSEKEMLKQMVVPKIERKGDKVESLTVNEPNLKDKTENIEEKIEETSKEVQDESTTEDKLKQLIEVSYESPTDLLRKPEEKKLTEEELDEIEGFSSDLEEKMKKLSIILQKIQEESKPINDEPLFSTSSKKLCTIPEEPKEENKVEPRKQEFLFNIKNTLDIVKERFEKNSLILKKVTDLKDNFMVNTNIKKLIDSSGLRQGDFPGKPVIILELPNRQRNELCLLNKVYSVIKLIKNSNLMKNK